MPDGPPAGRTPVRRPGHHGLRRARSQAGLILALLAVFTLCSATAGIAGLLLTVGNERALSAAVAQADGDELGGAADIATLAVTAATGDGVEPADAAVLAPLVRRTLLAAAAPYPATASLWVSSPLLFLDDAEVRRGYLLDADTISANADLAAGDWPTARSGAGPIPVAVPVTAADALGVVVGSRLRLAAERDAPGTDSYDLVVTGTFTPAETPAWTRDTLRGRGYDPAFLRLATFGPFVVAPGMLAALAAPVDQLVAVLDPDLGGDAAGVPGLVQRLEALPAQLRDEAGPPLATVRLWTGLGQQFGRFRAELAVTEALVVAVLLLVVALAAAAVALVARALADRRGTEFRLLRGRGAASSQLVRGAAVEAGGIALAAAALAVPLALAGYQFTAPAGAAASGPAPGSGFVLALVAGALLPAAVLVAATLPERPGPPGRALPGRLARSGIDLMAAVVAVVAYLQLRSHVPTPGSLDPLLVVAPVACVLAAAALTTRLVPLLLRAADGVAGRGRGFVLPLAGWQVARGGGGRGVFLLVLAAAVGTLGVTFLATWPQAQADQAAAAVGADLVVRRPGGPGTAAALDAATGGRSSPVADRPVVLGTRPDGVRLVALDARAADRLPVARPPAAGTWPALLGRLAPDKPAAPLTLAGGPGEITVTGGLTDGTGGRPAPVVTATVTLVLADEAGATTTLAAEPLALDGRPHTTRVPVPGQPPLPDGPWRVVAIDLYLTDHTEADLLAWGTSAASMQVAVTVSGATSDGGAWQAVAPADDGAALQPGPVTLAGDTVSAGFSYSVLGLSWQDAHLTLLGFPAGTALPVAMTDDLAGELGLDPGDRIGLRWGTSALEAELVDTVGYVPGRVGEPALLADLAALQRGLLSTGTLPPATDAWWIAVPRPGAVEALRQAGLGPVTDRAEVAGALRDGPLRAPLPTAWTLAVAAAIGLAVAGAGLAAAAEARRRGTTLARVRALGVSTRQALASQLVQQAATTTAGVLLGAACGAALAALLVPLLITAPTGVPAVPAPILAWPAPQLAGLLAAMLVGGLLAGLPATLAVLGRSTAAALRAGEAS